MWDARRILAAAAVAAGFGLLWLVGSNASSPNDSEVTPPSSTTAAGPIGPDARRTASGPPQLPGEPGAAIPPGLDFARPEVVARAYVVAAHSLTDADRDRTNRRVLPYLAPTNPANPRGLVVVAPPAGQTTTAVVDRLEVAFADEPGQTIAYQATWSATTGEARHPQTSYVVLQRQPDGRWLVTQETARLHPGD